MLHDNTQKRRIYVADDERNIRELIKSFLVSSGYGVDTFETGDLLYQAFLHEASDLIILDVNMPGTDGFTLCERIRSQSNVPIIIVSARDSEFDRITGISLGSDDYLVKPFSPSELVARVNGIFRRINLIQNSIDLGKQPQEDYVFGDLAIDEKLRVAKHDGLPIDLSPTEYDFLKYLVAHKDRAVSRDELLKEVWQYDFDVDTRATDDVVKRLRKKIAHTNVRIGAVWGFGFKLEIQEIQTQ